jgi:hypothetical protein
VLSDTGGGWRIVADSSATTQLTGAAQVDFVANNLNLDSERLRGVLVRGSLYVHEASGMPTSIASPYTYLLPSVLLGIGWQDSTGARHVLERSIRWVSIRACWRGEVAVFSFLTQADLDSLGDGTLSNIFLVVANHWWNYSPAPTARVSPEYGQFNLSVWPLHAGDLTQV